MKIKNVNIYTENKKFKSGWVEIKNDRIHKVTYSDFEESGTFDQDVLDGQGGYLIPGLIDMHLHGCMGADFCDGTFDAMEKIASFELSQGITSIVPATMTLPCEELKAVLKTAAAYVESGRNDATQSTFLGINMEGPFISQTKKGAQDGAHIIPCDTKVCEEFLQEADGLVKIVGIAPEENENFREFVREMKDKVHVSIAHSNASYEVAKEVFDNGVDYAVHLHNGMSPFHHRDPGIFGAVVDSPGVFAELICDGSHVHSSVIKATLTLLGEDRVIFVSDSMRGTGLSDGIYSLGGQDVKVKGKEAVLLSDGTLAGSVTTLMGCVRNAVKEMGIPFETAVGCATVNPARFLGIDQEYGSISEGKVADLILLNQALEIQKIIKYGKDIERCLR